MKDTPLSTPLVWVMYTCFLLIGLVMGMTGPLVPGLRADLGLGYGLAGLLFSAQSIGSLPVLFLGGWLVPRLGKKLLILGGGVGFSLGLAATAWASSFEWVLLGNVLIGASMSSLDVGVSTLCIEANREGKGKALNLLHFFFGAGAVLGPLFAMSLGQVESGWRWAFGLAAIGPLVIAVAISFLAVPPSHRAGDLGKKAVYRHPFLWWGALALLVYCGVEWDIGAWFPSFWKAIPGASALDPAWATSAFWLSFAVGRFVVGAWADRWGFVRFLTATVVATIVVSVLWIAFPQPAAAFVWVLLLGFIIAGQYPTFVALVSHRFPDSTGQVTSFLSIFAALGTFVWPPLVGAWADASGMQTLPWAQLGLAVLLGGVSWLAFRSAQSLDRQRQRES